MLAPEHQLFLQEVTTPKPPPSPDREQREKETQLSQLTEMSTGPLQPALQ